MNQNVIHYFAFRRIIVIVRQITAFWYILFGLFVVVIYRGFIF